MAISLMTENIIACNDDRHIRKFLEISVPDVDRIDAEIDCIDPESFNAGASKD